MRVSAILGIFLILGAVVFSLQGGFIGGVIMTLIGGSLIYLGFRPGYLAQVVFGHACIITGCMLVTWGVYLLPVSKPILSDIFTKPLFWGLFSIFGGICALFHSFCSCVGKRSASRCGRKEIDNV